ncbi:hypothetical protein MKW98_031747 [Papaver atlanticum]|uniref:Serine/threonine-protein phosphatase 4 regulatory subunit 2 n=1 Tax=Papaver atlanticum TaxID=357466 RepID=A0AAD4X8R2_9MAGN|nr:hypothetical protein MKW98_031747 [Papaver atlanticum]
MQVDKAQIMEMTSEENPQQPAAEYVANDDDHQYIYFGDSEPRFKISTGGELTEILSVIAATGKFWHPWEMLQMLLSFKLKQVLSEYPEAQLTSDQQTSKLGETYPDLVKRLDQALHSFIEGPPFTLQRICEILLAARNIYPNLSKLALALEKNLLVTSTLSVSTSTDPDPIVSREGDGPITVVAQDAVPKGQTEAIQNGVGGDEDEEMADAEEVSDEASKSGNLMEMAEEISTATPEASSDPITPSEPSNDSCPLSDDQQQQQPTQQPSPPLSQQSPPPQEQINTAS